MIAAFVVSLVFAMVAAFFYQHAMHDPVGDPRFYGFMVFVPGSISVASLVVGIILMF